MLPETCLKRICRKSSAAAAPRYCSDNRFRLREYLEAWGPPDIAFGGQQYCRWGPVIAPVGATDPQRGFRYWCAAACSRMLWVPVSIQMALWTMRSMMASAWTPEPRRWCQSFLAYWVQNTVEALS